MKFLLAALLLVPYFSYAEERVSLKDFLKSELAGLPKTSKENFSLTSEQKTKLKEIAPQAEESEFVFYYGKAEDGKIKKACTVVPQQGKEGLMNVGVCYLPNATVSNVVVLSAVEVRGQKALETSYLKQYQGKKVSDAFQVGKDVDGVTGATWTSKAIAEALRKTSYGLENFVVQKF